MSPFFVYDTKPLARYLMTSIAWVSVVRQVDSDK